MNLQTSRPHTAVAGGRIFRGIVRFFLLTALAMAALKPAVALPLVLILLAVASVVISCNTHVTGYVAIAQTVCKTE